MPPKSFQRETGRKQSLQVVDFNSISKDFPIIRSVSGRYKNDHVICRGVRGRALGLCWGFTNQCFLKLLA